MSQATLLPSEHFSPSVSLYSGRPATTSLEVAKFFSKRHDDVIRSIRNLRPNCPEKFTARNFAASEYIMEDCAGALDYSLRALESADRTMLAFGR